MPVTVVLFVALFAIGVDNYIIAAILPQIADDLGTAVAAVGLLASGYALPNAFLAPIFGPVSDRFGRRLVMLAGLAIFLAAVVASALAPTFELLLVARVVNGLGAALVIPAAFAYVADHTTPADRPRAMGALSAALPASTLLGVPLGAFAAAAVGWRGAFWVVGAATVVALVMTALLDSDRARPGVVLGYVETLRRIVTSRRSLGALLVTAIWFSATLGTFTYLGEFFQSSYGMPVEQAGLVFIIVGVMGVAATRLGSQFIGVIGAKRAVLVGISCFVVASLLLPLTAGWLLLSLLVVALWVFGTWFGLPAQQTLVSELDPDARGTLLAFNTSALFLGGVVGPAVSGVVLSVGGFALLGPWNSLVGAAALALAIVVLPGRQASTPSPEEPARAPGT